MGVDPFPKGCKEYVDIASPINSETRQMIEAKVFAEYRLIVGEPVVRRGQK